MTVSPDLTSLALCWIISICPSLYPSLAGRRKSSQSNLDRTSQLHELCRFPVGLVRFQSASSPARSRSCGSRTAPECGRHIVGTYTRCPSPLSLFCLFFQILFEQVQKPRSMIVECPKLARLTTQVDQHFENHGFEFCVFMKR